MDDQLIIEIWEVFKDYISDKNKEVAANQFVDFLQGQGVESSVFESLLGYDPHLDDAVNLVLEELKQEEEDLSEDDEINEWGDEEDY